MHYNRALSSLKNLQAVYLNIGKLCGGKNTLGDAERDNPDLWSGECDRCIEIMYEDVQFQEKWVARKKILDNNDPATRPPLLRRVEWRFWQAEDEEASDVDSVFNDDDDEQSSSHEHA